MATLAFKKEFGENASFAVDAYGDAILKVEKCGGYMFSRPPFPSASIEGKQIDILGSLFKFYKTGRD